MAAPAVVYVLGARLHFVTFARLRIRYIVAMAAALNALWLAFAGPEIVQIPVFAGHVLDQECLWIGIQRPPDGTHFPRLRQHLGVVNGCLPDERVALAAQPLDDAHVVCMEVSLPREPGLVGEP